ncbi:META domain-containing protein [Algoriphagus aestuarii]|nr:META domain-containing protein [Algoriphagus aestuarii]
MKAFRIFPVLFLAFLLIHCKPIQKTAVGMLIQNQWELQSLRGSTDLKNLFPSSLPFFDFDEAGKLSGFTGCNNFSGLYSLEGKDLKLDPGAITQKACLGEGENQFLEAIKQVNTFSGDAGKLILAGESGELMRLIPKNQEVKPAH